VEKLLGPHVIKKLAVFYGVETSRRRVLKNLPLVFIVRQMNGVRILTQYFCNVSFNIDVQSTTRCSNWLFR